MKACSIKIGTGYVMVINVKIRMKKYNIFKMGELCK